MKIKKIFLVLLTVLLIPTIVSAKVFEAGESNIDLKGEEDSSKVVFGNTVNNEATIDGIGLFFGNQVIGKGNTLYGGYAGNIVNISDNVEKDLFVAGNIITINRDAIINRDLFIAGNMITINTDVKRNLNVAGSTIDLSGVTIYGDAHLYAESITFDDDTKIEGTLYVSEDTTLNNLKSSMYADIVKEATTEVEPTIKDQITEVLTSALSSYVCIVIILLMFKCFRKSLVNVKVQGKEVALTTLIGLASIVGIPVLFIIALATGLLAPLALVVIALYLIFIYLANLVVSYVIGHYIWTNKKDANVFIEALIGVVLLKVLSVIPVINGIVGTIVFLYGFGIITKLIIKLIKE